MKKSEDNFGRDIISSSYPPSNTLCNEALDDNNYLSVFRVASAIATDLRSRDIVRIT